MIKTSARCRLHGSPSFANCSRGSFNFGDGVSRPVSVGLKLWVLSDIAGGAASDVLFTMDPLIPVSRAQL